MYSVCVHVSVVDILMCMCLAVPDGSTRAQVKRECLRVVPDDCVSAANRRAKVTAKVTARGDGEEAVASYGDGDTFIVSSDKGGECMLG